MSEKTKGDSVAINIDIFKTFDTLSFDFLLQVLHHFGFHHIFINWIHVIL